MGIYKFEKIKNIFVVGDCHGEFKKYFHDIKMGINVKSEDVEPLHPKEIERRERRAAKEEARRQRGDGYTDIGFETRANIRPSSKLDELMSRVRKSNGGGAYQNSLFIVAGDCGIGFNKPKYYEDLFTKFNNILSYNNTYIVFVRGNHDDPAYFDGERINYSNIKAVPDYSVISANSLNILCVGGAISLDRTWRIKQEERINRFSISKKKQLYWKDEAPVFDKEAIENIAKDIKIDCVVSHSAPSFVEPESHNGLDEWQQEDSKLADDLKEERKTLDRVFETLRDCGTKPTYWAYGHFDNFFIEKRSDTIFRGLSDGFNPIKIMDDIAQFAVKKTAKKKVARKSLLKSDHNNQAVFDDGDALDLPDLEPINGRANAVDGMREQINNAVEYLMNHGRVEVRHHDNDNGLLRGVELNDGMPGGIAHDFAFQPDVQYVNEIIRGDNNG